MKLFELWFPKIRLNLTFWKHEILCSSWNHKWITISLRSQKASGPCEIIKATVGNYSNKECIALKLSSSQLTKYDKQIRKVHRKIIWVNYSNKKSSKNCILSEILYDFQFYAFTKCAKLYKCTWQYRYIFVIIYLAISWNYNNVPSNIAISL